LACTDCKLNAIKYDGIITSHIFQIKDIGMSECKICQTKISEGYLYCTKCDKNRRARNG